jgi:hypothetical protein
MPCSCVAVLERVPEEYLAMSVLAAFRTFGELTCWFGICGWFKTRFLALRLNQVVDESCTQSWRDESTRRFYAERDI